MMQTNLHPASANRFAQAAPAASKHMKTAAPQFGKSAAVDAFAAAGGRLVPKINGLVKHFDFEELGASTVKQIQLIYAACILSRLAAAAQRSRNEVRETAIRDSMGYAFWFFATPMIQRAFLAAVPKDYRAALIQETNKPTGAGVKATLKKLNWTVNPLSRYQITSSQQVQDWAHQALRAYVPKDRLESIVTADAGHGLSRALKSFFVSPIKGEAQQIARVLSDTERQGFNKMARYYQNLSKFRNLATGVGMVSSIALLGIVIPLWNIYTTKRNVARGKVGLSH